jgi:hypothetical protein
MKWKRAATPLDYKCSDGYKLGEAGATIVSLAGGAGLASRSLVKRAGNEWSHWIPSRYVRPLTLSGKNPNKYYIKWLDKYFGSFVRGRLNGNYVDSVEHYLTDPFRFPKRWRAIGPRFSKWRQQLNRVPQWISGAAFIATGATRAVDTAEGSCGCP